MSKKNTSIAKSTRFEDALLELEQLVQTLETGEQNLQQSLQQFERGVALSRFCQNALDEAEHKVQILLENGETQNFSDTDPAK